MIRSSRTGDMLPSAAVTNPGQQRFDQHPFRLIENHRRKFEQRLLEFPAMVVETQNGFPVLVVLAIDSFPGIAVEAGAVSSPGEVEGEEVHEVSDLFKYKDRAEDGPALLKKFITPGEPGRPRPGLTQLAYGNNCDN